MIYDDRISNNVARVYTEGVYSTNEKLPDQVKIKFHLGDIWAITEEKPGCLTLEKGDISIRMDRKTYYQIFRREEIA